MITLGESFRRYGPAYREKFGERMPANHRAVMTAIEQCRTEALGGHVYTCPACATTCYRYHSCRNRHCPTCQQGQVQTWLAKQHELLLPVPYFLVTFDDYIDLLHVYPTMAEALKIVAISCYKDPAKLSCCAD